MPLHPPTCSAQVRRRFPEDAGGRRWDMGHYLKAGALGAHLGERAGGPALSADSGPSQHTIPPPARPAQPGLPTAYLRAAASGRPLSVPWGPAAQKREGQRSHPRTPKGDPAHWP